MRISDLAWLSVKTLKGRWAALPVIGFAIAAFCLCFAGAILATMQEEKAQPYELVISSEGANRISDNDVIEISKLEDVTAATPVLQIPVSMSAGDYTANISLTGMDANYLEQSFGQGGAFPDDSVMPYIVLNEAALGLFSDNETSRDNVGDMNHEEGTGHTARTDTEAPNVDWLNVNLSVQLGEGMKAVTSKVCGILSADEDEAEYEEPAAYISISTAKELLQQSGQNTDYTTDNVRVKNIGCADDVSKAIAALGLMVTNSTDELQRGWDADNKEMTYLIVIGVFSLICASFLLAAWRTVSSLRQKDTWEAMRCLGMQERHISRMYTLQTILLSLFGVAVGVLVAIALPSFLSAETQESSFMIQVPLIIAVVSVMICIVSGIVASVRIRREKDS